MADSQDDQDFSKLPLDERIQHKNWKARVSAYEDLAKAFPTFEDKEFTKYGPLIKKFVLDTNAAAQEKGLAAVLAYVDYCPAAGKVVESVVAGLAAKCLNSTRAKTRELAVDIVLMCVEIERQEAVLEELIKALDQKTPKNVAAVVRMIKQALNLFGSKVIAIKPIVPKLESLLEHKDPGIREETKQLCIEIYRWVKDALLPQLSNLKPILLDSLKEEFEKVKSAKATPQRLLRSQQQHCDPDETDGEANPAMQTSLQASEASDEATDPFELLDPVDIVSQLPADFYTLLEAKKWQERKVALENLLALLEKNPKLLATADYGELVKNLKRIIGKDTNIVVATVAIRCLCLLCTGLRKGFEKHAHGCVTVLLEKFKEKKANVVASLREAIDAVYIATNMEAIQEDLTAALDNKNPSIRSETALFMARAFARTNPALINKKLLKVFVTSLLKTLGDSDPTVRESSAEALGTAAKAQGDRNMGPLLLGLEALKMAKIEEYKAKVEVKKFAAMPPPPATSAAAPSSAPAKARPVRKPATRVIKPPSTGSSAESLDMPDPPAPKLKPTTISRNKATSASSSAANSFKNVTLRRPGTTAGSRLAKPSSLPASTGSALKKSAPEDTTALMQPLKVAKEQRLADERSLKVLKWNFSTPREEFYAQLREQMEAAAWAPALVTQCFHADFKHHIKAIDAMNAFFAAKANDDDGYDLLVANLDLILKWTALRFFDTNPSVLMKALDLLKLIFSQLASNSYSMSDSEANAFLPYLVRKSGDAKDVVRGKVKDILLTSRAIYPPAKIFSHLMDGLSSKNARQRSTCLEEIAALIESEGMTVFGAAGGGGPSGRAGGGVSVGGGELKDIAKCVSERDTSVRNGALACIVKVYQYKGEDVYKLVGNLNDKDMSLIEERIKRVPKSALKMGNTQVANNEQASQMPTANSRFGATLTRQQVNQHYNTPESNPEANTNMRGGTLTKGTISKIGSLTNVMHAVGGGGGLSATPNFGSGSPYDTYQAKPRGNTGTISKARSMIGLGLGPKANSLVGFGLNRGSPASGTPLQSRLAFTASPAPGSETSDAESGVNGFETQSDRRRSTLTMEHSPDRETTEQSEQQQQHTPSSSLSVVTTSASESESDDLDRRVREALAAPEPDPAMIARIRSKFGAGGYVGAVGGMSPRGSGIAYYATSPSSASTVSTRSPHNGHSPSSFNATAGGSNSFTLTPTSTQPPPQSDPMAVKLTSLFADLSSSEVASVTGALEHLNHLLTHYDVARYGPFLEPKVVQLVALCNKQLRLFLTKHYPESKEGAGKEAETLFRSVALTLVNLFRSPLGRLASRDSLRELITHLLPFFLEEMKRPENQPIFDSVNYVIQEMIRSADATNLLSALIHMLHDYVGGSTGEVATSESQSHLDIFLSLTMKFIWRIVKFFDRYYEHMKVDVILLESHHFFKSYPRSWWKNNHRDDLPLRTIKTLVYLFVRKQGDAILEQLNLIECKDESELSYYVQKSLRQCENASAKDGSAKDENSSAVANGGSLKSNGGHKEQLNSSSATSKTSVDDLTAKMAALGMPSGALNGNGTSHTVPRTLRADFPLATVQLNNNSTSVPPLACNGANRAENGELQHPPIPLIRSGDDLSVLCEYTSRTLNMPQLNYAAIHAQAQANPSLKTVADANAAVALARQRLETFKARIANQQQ